MQQTFFTRVSLVSRLKLEVFSFLWLTDFKPVLPFYSTWLARNIGNIGQKLIKTWIKNNYIGALSSLTTFLLFSTLYALLFETSSNSLKLWSFILNPETFAYWFAQKKDCWILIWINFRSCAILQLFPF